jgi:hypothetical protein
MRCPRCGSADVVPIVYGLPSRKMIEDCHAGRIALGGCCVFPHYPDHLCDSCGHKWQNSPNDLEMKFSEGHIPARRSY